MDIKELERLELRERYFKFNSERLWKEAISIWYNKVDWDKRNIFWKIFNSPYRKRLIELKNIQMGLLNEEISKVNNNKNE